MRLDLTARWAFVLAVLTGFLTTCQSTSVLAENNWLAPQKSVRHARYNARHQRLQPSSDPFVDDDQRPIEPLEEVAPRPRTRAVSQPRQVDQQLVYSTEDEGEYCCDLRFSTRGVFFGGADYIYVRPTFSEAVAWTEVQLNGVDITETLVEHDFGYSSSQRAYAGYRFCDCGTEIRFTWSNYGGNAEQLSAVADANTSFVGHLETVTNIGDRITSNAKVDITTYDISYAKTICLGDPLDCCQESCGRCRRWDLTWMLSARIADIGWDNRSVVTNTANAVTQTGATRMQFQAAGPRAGIEGRYYFGPQGNLSFFASSNISMLLGQYNIKSQRVTTITEVQQATLTRLIPVIELELGISYRYSDLFAVHGGYLFHAYHDMGMTDQNIGNLPPYDDANILSFDGLFIRGEVTF